MLSFTNLAEVLEKNGTAERTLTYIDGKESEKTITFEQLHQQALSLLCYFQQQGLKPGDELIIFLRDNQSFLNAFWAAILGGMIPVPVAVGISDEHRSKLYKIYNRLNKPNIFTDEDNLSRLEKYAESNDLNDEYKKIQQTAILNSEITDLSLQGTTHYADPDDVCFIQFSSGSTSDPKGVVLTHRNLILNVLAKAKAGGYNKDDIALSWMPLTHDMGLIGFHINMLVCYMHHCIMATDLFSRRPVLWLEKVSEKKATVICSPNFGYKHFLKALGDKKLDKLDLSCVRVILNGAEPISTRLCDEFLERMAVYGLKHNTMLPVYGLAEATLAVAFPKWGQDYRSVHVDRHKLKIGDVVSYLPADNSNAVSFPVVGFAVADIQIRIGDIDGSVYSENVVGSIFMVGPTVTQGYYGDEQATSDVLTPDGWFDTGDLGFISNNELVITGRSKEIIFAHGQNYYPHDLESVLIRHCDIELGKVAVYGVWDEKRQRDEIIVFVIYRAGIEDFVTLARSLSATLNEQTGLEIDYVLPVKQIPKTTSGKFQRRILADGFVNGQYDEVITTMKRLSQVDDEYGNSVVENQTAPDLQQHLLKICNQTLEDQVLKVDDNFFETGISSLALSEMHQCIDDEYPDMVDITDLFEYQSVSDLAKFIEEKSTTLTEV